MSEAYPTLRLHIDGEWIDVGSRRVHRVINPATGDGLGELPLAGPADLDRALDASDRGFRLWKCDGPAGFGVWMVLHDAKGPIQ